MNLYLFTFFMIFIWIRVFLGFGPKQQYLTYLSARNILEMLIAIKRLSFVLSCSYKYARDR